MRKVSPEDRETNLRILKDSIDVDFIVRFFALYNYKIEDFYKDVGHSRQYLSGLFSGLTPLNDELAKKINETFDRVSADLIRNSSRADTATAKRVVDYVYAKGKALK
ncbi:helix-turn-helix domain-containing protein [Succinivibrio dextrinosolvens]|uniref:helix-turn-helix domain-containing protein n=1 Tax=Succinivibrio dextrinosolvens TaxID=83771 RepID=UPI00241C25B3|nr:helix-turn-helix transcriptional regulator [Succinivibrio dextrinosolvens]MBE6422806.1 helix-turn-helix transcriptional regulator [Succinivibrio dextrinosolvens]